MNSIDQKVKDYLASLDQEPYRPITDFEVSEGISAVLKTFEEKVTGESFYEVLAFELSPRSEGRLSGWGTFFGSKMSFQNDEDGLTMEFPSLQQVEKAAVEYWSKRAREAKHPILVERYADLAGDFSKHVGVPFDHTLAQLAVDSALLICEHNLVQGIYQRHRLHRALNIARLINDTGRIRQIAEATIATEKKIATDNKPGLWGFAFKWLVLENEGPEILNEDEIQELVKEIEDRIARLMAVEDPDPWGVECAVNLLVPYYINKEDTMNTMRVLLTLEEAFKKNKRSNSDGMLKVNYLEKLDALYRQNGKLPEMRVHIDRIAKELPAASRESLDSLKTITTEIPIQKEDIEAITNTIFGDLKTPLPLKDVVIRLIANFLIRKEHMQNQVKEHSKKFVFQFIVSQRRMSSDGHTETVIPPLEKDYEAHVFNHAFQNAQIMAPFLGEVMRVFKRKFTFEEIETHLKQSVLFVDEEKEYLLVGLKAYWDNNYLVATQNFIPYIESAFRRLIAGAGGITLRPGNKYGGYEYRTMSAMLDDEIINGVFGFDISFYFKVLLTHPLGWNLRNNLAHGVNLNSFFRQDVADRLFHVLLLLSLVIMGTKAEVK